MSVHDTIGDFITVIRNAGQAGKRTVLTLIRIYEKELRKFLKNRGFVEDYQESNSDKGFKILQIKLKYISGNHAIKGISRVSTPGRRSYCGYREIPSVLGGLGISIISSPKGIVDDRTARQEKLGGELLCSVW